MNKTPREIRSYDYVNHPYQRVRDALQKDAPAVFQSATKSAVSRAQSVANCTWTLAASESRPM